MVIRRYHCGAAGAALQSAELTQLALEFPQFAFGLLSLAFGLPRLSLSLPGRVV
jgi:hypothetical protein